MVLPIIENTIIHIIWTFDSNAVSEAATKPYTQKPNWTVPYLHGKALIPVYDPAQYEHVSANHGTGALLPGGRQDGVGLPHPGADVVGDAVVPELQFFTCE